MVQYFGLGSETRKTVKYVPDPYGIEVGNPVEVPPGYEERWLLNVHAIETRGCEDRMGCTECRCDLYNVTKDEYDRDIEPNYFGGLRCCHDETRCRTREGFQGPKRSLYLKYTIKYVDWHAFIIPVKIYILDVTDTWKRWKTTGLMSSRHHCQIEYEVESCSAAVANNGCIHTKKISVTLPNAGDVIYGVAHQHAGGTGSTLLGERGYTISTRPASNAFEVTTIIKLLFLLCRTVWTPQSLGLRGWTGYMLISSNLWRRKGTRK